ncbi:MAG: FecR family protein [Boseongicola sp.]
MCANRFSKVLSIALVFFLGAGPVLASIGKVVDVRPGATLTAGGSTKKISAGMKIDSGDVIVTDAKGIVQLVFKDETKIAVGPNARMIVDASMMRGSNRARNFAVKALGGSFRFISGKSDSAAYSIKTPNATMGIRGTAFDFWVDGNSQTAVAMLEGQVRMCESGGGCAVISGRCSLATAVQGRAITRQTKVKPVAQILVAGFPFILSQRKLKKQLWADSAGCDRAVTLLALEEKPDPEPPEKTNPAQQ